MLSKRAAVTSLLIAFYLMFSSNIVYGQGNYPPQNDLYFNDYAKVINPEDVKQIKDMLIDLKSTNDIDMVVLTIKSIHDYQTGDSTIETFATNLFNTWGIGNSATNKGVLILVAVQDREVRIELGSGYGSEYNGAMQKVIDQHMLPYFKESQYYRGIYLGVKASIENLTSPMPSNAVSQPPVTSSKEIKLNGGTILLISGIIGGALLIISAPRYKRFRKRKCPNCGETMNRLDEVSDDTYLNSGQKLEEVLHTVDYDVWKCPSCGMHSIYEYPNPLSRSNKCPKCNYRTLGVTRKTIEAPSYTSIGQEEVITKCRHCKYREKDIITLPMLASPTNESNNNYSNTTYNDNTFNSHSDSGGQSSGDGASGKW